MKMDRYYEYWNTMAVLFGVVFLVLGLVVVGLLARAVSILRRIDRVLNARAGPDECAEASLGVRRRRPNHSRSFELEARVREHAHIARG